MFAIFIDSPPRLYFAAKIEIYTWVKVEISSSDIKRHSPSDKLPIFTFPNDSRESEIILLPLAPKSRLISWYFPSVSVIYPLQVSMRLILHGFVVYPSLSVIPCSILRISSSLYGSATVNRYNFFT